MSTFYYQLTSLTIFKWSSLARRWPVFFGIYSPSTNCSSLPWLHFHPLSPDPNTHTHTHTHTHARTHARTHTPRAGTRTAGDLLTVSHFDPFLLRAETWADTHQFSKILLRALHPSAHPGSPRLFSPARSSSHRHAFWWSWRSAGAQSPSAFSCLCLQVSLSLPPPFPFHPVRCSASVALALHHTLRHLPTFH